MDFENNENRIITPDFTETDKDIENSLRPKTLNEYIGQEKVKENLRPSGTGKNNTRRHNRQRNGRSDKSYKRSCN